VAHGAVVVLEELDQHQRLVPEAEADGGVEQHVLVHERLVELVQQPLLRHPVLAPGMPERRAHTKREGERKSTRRG
jgi:hypothetical protein